MGGGRDGRGRGREAQRGWSWEWRREGAEPALLWGLQEGAGGVFPAEGSGKGGPLSPCLGLGKDRTKDNVRGRRRWCTKALLSLKGGGLYSILFARLKKNTSRERQTDRQKDKERETEFA